ncbi:MAG: hypothetical protein ACI4RK_02320 [Oscillospiraceae bacterium]
MTAQETAVEQFRTFAEGVLGESVTVGFLPREGGTAMQIVAGTREFTSLSKEVRRAEISLDVLSKNKNQSRTYGALCELANSCDNAELPAPVANVQAREPVFVGKDGEFWIYSLTVSLRIMI